MFAWVAGGALQSASPPHFLSACLLFPRIWTWSFGHWLWNWHIGTSDPVNSPAIESLRAREADGFTELPLLHSAALSALIILWNRRPSINVVISSAHAHQPDRSEALRSAPLCSERVSTLPSSRTGTAMTTRPSLL
ncbi:hypothetical protein BDW71DRAFT_4202 [Aspergillus fruticulosus]